MMTQIFLCSTQRSHMDWMVQMLAPLEGAEHHFIQLPYDKATAVSIQPDVIFIWSDVTTADKAVAAFIDVKNMFGTTPIFVASPTYNESVAPAIMKAGARFFLAKDRLTFSELQQHIVLAVPSAANPATHTSPEVLDEQQARQRLAAVFNHTNDIILLANDEGRLVQVNRMACELLGYSEAELLRLHVNEIGSAMEEDETSSYELWQSFMHDRKQVGLIQLRKKSGQQIICMYNATASILPGIHLSILNDITIQETNRRKMEDQSRRIENILNNISECFFTMDKNWIVTYWNKSAEKLIGLSRETVLGRSFWDHYPEKKKAVFVPYYEQVMSGNEAINFEEFYKPLNIWVSVKAYATREGVAVFFTDITATKKLAQEIQETRNNQAALINSTSNLIWSLDKEMKLLSFNDAYKQRIKEMVGHEAYEGMQLPIFFHQPAEIKKWKNYYQRALNGEVYTIEDTIVHPDKEKMKRAEITFKPFYTVDTHEIKGVTCYSHDITQREAAKRKIEEQNRLLKQNEQHLEKLTRQLAKIMNSSMDVICSIDKDGRFIQVSNACVHLWGYEQHEMEGRRVLDFVAAQYVQSTRDAAVNIVHGAVYTDFENTFIHKKGHLIPLIWSARWDKDESIMFCVARDSTSMKEAEKLRAETEQRISALVEKGADIIGILDEQANYIYISPNVKTLLGYEPEMLLNKNALKFVHPADVEIAMNELNRVFTAGEVKLAAFRYKNAFGDWRWIETVATSQLHNPAIKGIVISSRDITGRKQIEAERELMIKELLKSNADLKQFSFITSHNLRAPLSNIIGILNIIEYDALDSYNRELIQMLDKSVRQLSDTISDLAKILIVKNNVNIEISSIELQEAFDKVKNVFLNKLNDVCGNVSLDFQAPKIPFNPTYFESILVNLLSNSIKYRSLDRDLNITVKSWLDGKGRVVLEFADNGIGIDLTRHRNKLFGLYQRFHDHTEGNGLGLFIVKSQIEALGGKIEVQSGVDKGTTFTITFKKG